MADQANLNQEFTQFASSIDQIAARTSFNGISLLDANGTVTLQVGSGDRVRGYTWCGDGAGDVGPSAG